ncbi:acyltransferase family protein, partial [Bosea sp. 2RAB26]|uniref:acyltransferase family protein n=1 Tax=Bosea sp. 2RAB26 TaxID=3237476 RepID=UPI003F9082E2
MNSLGDIGPMPDARGRDVFLDCLKGLAIITVVLGHTFQGVGPRFDDYMPFKVVYSFHMPMFIFVSGMVASIGFKKKIFADVPPGSFIVGLGKSSVRLLLPFFTWALVSFYLLQSSTAVLSQWMLLVVSNPDNGLWFLWVLFQCQIVLALISASFAALRRYRPINLEAIRPVYVVALLLLVAYPTRKLFLATPNESGLHLTKIYLIYFLAGVLSHIWRPKGLPAAIRWAPYLAFALAVPFWHRSNLSPLVEVLPAVTYPDNLITAYQYLVGFAGTFAFVDFARVVANRAPRWVAQALSYIGARSLDIYAIHLYALGVFPPVIAPIALSLAASAVLRTNPVTSWLCFGQWKRSMSLLPTAARSSRT